MAQAITPAARDLLAHHYSIMASLTPEQRQALDREALAKNAATFTGRDWRESLIATFERIAADLAGPYGRPMA